MLDPTELPCVGVVLADIVPDAVVKRFERILSCYGDFRKEFEQNTEKTTKPKRPPPPAYKPSEFSMNMRYKKIYI